MGLAGLCVGVIPDALRPGICLKAAADNAIISKGKWRARRDSNSRPLGS
jgi:hypothetical protein